jgi:hypothetical protein
MSSINKILLVVLILIIFFGFFYFRKNSTSNISVLPIASLTTEKSEGKYYTMDLSYPESSVTKYPEIYAFATSTVQDFLNQAENISDSDAAMMGLGGDRIYNLTMTTRIATSTQTVTYIIEAYTFMGGAHGNTDVATFTYDKAGKLVTLDDIFSAPYLEKIAGLSRTYFYNTLGDYMNPEMIDPGTTATTTNFSTWYLTDANITFIFGQYQVGPYVIGMPEFSISKTNLSDILSEKYQNHPF